MLCSVTSLPIAPLRPSSLGDLRAIELAQEANLRASVDAHREAIGLAAAGVCWDDELSDLLSPALASYESERLTGHSIDAPHFADAVRRIVPNGHTFKGFPHHFLNADARYIFSTWLRDEVALDIVQCRTLKAKLAVRMRVATMADDVVSVWAMIAIAYRPDV